jgi:hypothetical protein
VRYILALLLIAFVTPARAQVTGQPCNSTAIEGSRICKVAGGVLDQAVATTGASAGFFMIFDSATVPADGIVTPVRCYAMAASSTTGVGPGLNIPFNKGIVFVFSTGANCGTKTVSATAWFGGQAQ